MTDRIIKVRAKDQYGTAVYHPANSTAQLFADIAGTKTLTVAALKKAARLGFVVDVVQEDSRSLEQLLLELL